MNQKKFWPLDFDPEGEVYENLAWDLPGYTHRQTRPTAQDNGQIASLGKETAVKNTPAL